MAAAESDYDKRFAFVRLLGDELSHGNLELPSFPDIVIRVRQALEDEMSTTEEIVQIIGAEPVLAARLLKVANSAALRPSGDSISDLRTAVNRVGRSIVRSSTMSFAMAQMRNSRKLDAVKSHLMQLWAESTHVAALCYVLTRKFTKMNPDEALFVGLMHGIGKMYILVRAEDYPELFENEEDMLAIMDEWNCAIGSAISEHWGFAEYVSAAIRDYQQIDRDHDHSVDYTDILILAHLLFNFVNAEDDLELNLDNVPACRHLNLAASNILSVIQESDEQIMSLKQALGK